MRLALAFALLTTTATAQGTCGRDDDACEVPLGTYRAALPEVEVDGPHPAIIFLHGAGGTGRGTLGMTGTIDALTGRGYVVLAPDGIGREGRGGGFWSFLPESQRPRLRDERTFFDEIVADAVDRFDVDADRVILSGFSAGAFMVTTIACETPDAFAAYAPVSGGFWDPIPESCAGPVRLFHTHGWTDGTVPLEGRSLGGGRFQQSDILEGLHRFRDANGCEATNPSGHRTTDRFLRRYWTCDEGSALEFALFPGGHGVPNGWAGMMLDWFEADTGG